MIPPMHLTHVPGADPQRDAIVARLVDECGACVHTDPDRRGYMPTFLELLDCTAADTPHRWTLLLDDDAEPLPGWEDHLEQAIWHSPQPFLGLTHFGTYGQKAIARGAPYATGPYLLWGGAFAIRQALLPGFVDYVKMIWNDTGYPHGDVLACAYAMRLKHRTALTARAIFDQPIQASLLGHNTKIRRPATTIANSTGPRWSALPRSVKVSRSIAPEIPGLAGHRLHG